MKKVTVLTATTGRSDLLQCIKSVRAQTYRPIEHLVIVDGLDALCRARSVFAVNDGDQTLHNTDDFQLVYVDLPKSIGKDRWNGHRIYAAGTYMADGDYVCFLDDDNYLEPDHIESLVRVIEKEFRDWSFSLRYLINAEGKRIGEDNCESLGKWPSVINPNDYFVDVNCFMLPTKMAVEITPAWYRKFREPNQPEVDRVLTHVLRTRWPNYDSNYKHSVAYKVSGGALSVQPEFFERGNAEMLRRFNGKLPWLRQ